MATTATPVPPRPTCGWRGHRNERPPCGPSLAGDYVPVGDVGLGWRMGAATGDTGMSGRPEGKVLIAHPSQAGPAEAIREYEFRNRERRGTQP